MKYNIKFKLGLEGIGDFLIETLSEEETENLFKEIKQRKEKIEQEGRLGEEYSVEIEVIENPLLDFQEPQLKIESYKMKIIDLNDETFKK